MAPMQMAQIPKIPPITPISYSGGNNSTPINIAKRIIIKSNCAEYSFGIFSQNHIERTSYIDIMGFDLASTSRIFFLSSMLEFVFILIPLIVFKLQKKNLKEEFRTRIIPIPRPFKRRMLDIGIGLGIGYLFVYLGGFLAIFIRQITIQIFGSDFYGQAVAGSVNTTPPSMEVWEVIITFIIMFGVVGFSEEFCFRGILFKEFSKKSPILGLLLSSGLFMIYHVFPGVVPIQTFVTFWLYYFTFGIILGILTWIQKGDLLTAIIAHGTFNSLLFAIQFL
jgi:membrane protease YdiL (CAAX protease family)